MKVGSKERAKKKLKMEFHDERVKQEYVDDLIEFEEPASGLSAKFLNMLLPILVKGEQNPESFVITATNVCEWTKQKKRYNLTRLIDGENSPFVLGKDYIYDNVKTARGQNLKEIFMTVETFKQLITDHTTEFGRQILKYVWKVEKAYRDHYGTQAKDRLVIEDKNTSPPQPRNKVILAPGIKLTNGMGHYILSFAYKGKNYFYHGSTGDIRTRLSKHKNEIPNGSDITVIEWQNHPRARMIEECRDGYGAKIQVPIPEGIRGMRSLYFDNPQFWDVVNQCKSCVVDAEKKWQEGPGKCQTETPPLESADMYPIQKSKERPRKNQNSPTHGRIARYETGKPPRVVSSFL